MKSWRLKSDEIAMTARRELFSTPATRVDMIDLAGNEEVGEAGDGVVVVVVIQVLSGSVDVTSGDETISCADGGLVALAPGEAGSVLAIEQSRFTSE